MQRPDVTNTNDKYAATRRADLRITRRPAAAALAVITLTAVTALTGCGPDEDTKKADHHGTASPTATTVAVPDGAGLKVVLGNALYQMPVKSREIVSDGAMV